MPSMHRLRHGLPGYLILFAPRAFVTERQKCANRMPSPWVFRMISTHFTTTPYVPSVPHTLEICRFERDFRVELEIVTPD